MNARVMIKIIHIPRKHCLEYFIRKLISFRVNASWIYVFIEILHYADERVWEERERKIRK